MYGPKMPIRFAARTAAYCFRGSTSYVLSFFAGAMALTAHAYSLMSVNRASSSIAFAKKLNI